MAQVDSRESLKEYASGTLSAPSRDDCMRSVSKVLHRMVSERTENTAQSQRVYSLGTGVGQGEVSTRGINRSTASFGPISSPFDLENFVHKSLQVVLPMQARVLCFTGFTQLDERREPLVPSSGKLRFITKMFNARNWRPIVLSAVLTSSKVWDDLSSWNIEFAEVFPIFTLKDINALERLFLEGLKYNLFVSGSMYAQYYFALRALRGTDAKNVPRLYMNVSMGAALKVEAKSIIAQTSQIECSSGDDFVSPNASPPNTYG